MRRAHGHAEAGAPYQPDQAAHSPAPCPALECALRPGRHARHCGGCQHRLGPPCPLPAPGSGALSRGVRRAGRARRLPPPCLSFPGGAGRGPAPGPPGTPLQRARAGETGRTRPARCGARGRRDIPRRRDRSRFGFSIENASRGPPAGRRVGSPGACSPPAQAARFAVAPAAGRARGDARGGRADRARGPRDAQSRGDARFGSRAADRAQPGAARPLDARFADRQEAGTREAARAHPGDQGGAKAACCRRREEVAGASERGAGEGSAHDQRRDGAAPPGDVPCSGA